MGGEPDDRGERRLERQGAGAGLHRADVTVGDPVAAIEGRDEVEVPDRPKIERREVAGLIENAPGEERSAHAITDEDAAALERKADGGGQGHPRAGFDGERVGRDRRRDRDLSGEVEVIIRGDEIIRLVLIRKSVARGEGAVTVDLLVEGAGVRRAAIGCAEGGPETSLGVIDQYPGHNTFVLRIVPTALAIPGDDTVPPKDGVTQAGAEVGTADEQAGSRRARPLRRRDVVGDGAVETQASGVGVRRLEGDDRRATVKGAAAEIFGRVVGGGGTNNGEVAASEGDIIGGAALEVAVAVIEGGREAAKDRTLAGRVVDGQRGALIQEERRAPGGVGGEVDRTLAEDERAAGDVGVDQHILRVGDGERAGAVLLDGVELVIRRPPGGGDLRPRQGDVAGAGEVELALLRVLLDAARNGQVARRGTDGRVDRHADGADVSVITREVLQDTAEIDAAEQLIGRGTRGDGVIDRDPAAELQGRTDRGGIERNQVAPRAGRGGVDEVDRPTVDGKTAGEMIGSGQGQSRAALLRQASDTSDLLDRPGERDRVGEVENHGGIQEDRARQRTARGGTANRTAARNTRTRDPDGVWDGALDIERRGVSGHHQRLASGSTERIDAPEREGPSSDGDVAGEGRVGVTQRNEAARHPGDTEITATGELADVVELDHGGSTEIELATARTDRELLGVEIRIKGTRAQLEPAAVEDDLAGGAGGAERASRGIGAVVGVTRHRERAAVDEDVARKTVGARQHQGALPCLGQAAGRGGGYRCGDVQRVAGGVGADNQVQAGGRSQPGRTGDGRSRAARGEDGRRVDQTARDERRAVGEFETVDGDPGRLGDRAGRTAGGVEPIRLGNRERGGGGDGGGERGV